MSKGNRKIWFWLMSLSALLIGLYPFIYFFIDRKFGLLASKADWLLADFFWNMGFYTHIVLGGISLLIGWIQFSKTFRKKYPQVHRQVGKIYVVCELFSGLASLYIGVFATGGLISSLGFMSLGVIWLGTTFLAYRHIKQGNFAGHETMMIYSYACCFGAVTLRIWLPLLTLSLGSFVLAYKIVAWLSWVPNLIVAYFIARKGPQSSLTPKRT